MHAYGETGSLSAIVFKNGAILGNINKTASKIPCFCRLERCRRKSVPCAVCGHEIFHWCKSFLVLRDHRERKHASYGVCNKPFHSCHLRNGTYLASGTRLQHVIYRAVWVKSIGHQFFNLRPHVLPYLYRFPISFVFGKKTLVIRT